MDRSTDSTSNSTAASQAVLLARDNLLQALDGMEYEDTTHSTPDAASLDYIRRIECYSNHKVCGTLERCDLKPAEWQKVCYAAQEAKEIHKMPRSSVQSTLVSGAMTGTNKTYSVTKRTEDGIQYLIIAIRATRTPFDWMVNLNADLVDLAELTSDVKCHKGFLSVARNMRSSIEDAVKEQTSMLDGPVNVILTGHSSGAAVAQLLYAVLFAPDTTNAGEFCKARHI
ncbi:lipase precursor [Apiospora rasikravindrae]|uniref:Lipase n=1 Tax=Apiospora rasikravindrae TaxID=990691 RepID=A0ABR1U8D0_9PEZI